MMRSYLNKRICMYNCMQILWVMKLMIEKKSYRHTSTYLYTLNDTSEFLYSSEAYGKDMLNKNLAVEFTRG